GWQTATEIEIIPFLSEYAAKGIKQAFVTDIARDGLLQGPSTELYASIATRIPTIDLIASGGVRNVDDIRAIEKAGCSGVIIGKAIYEGLIELKDLSEYVG